MTFVLNQKDQIVNNPAITWTNDDQGARHTASTGTPFTNMDWF